MTRLWDKGGELDETVLRYTAGEDHLLDGRLVAYDVKASIAHAGMLHAAGYLSDDDHGAIVDGLGELAATHAAGDWSISLEEEDVHTALEQRWSRGSERRASGCTLGGRAMTRCWPRCACTSRMPPNPCAAAPRRWPWNWRT